ncbi:MAG: AAA family ATPase [Candidatus Diapherotrites archaeon]|nr:AAA family ATPase [Candidatus Diapherotrites archaeon]
MKLCETGTRLDEIVGGIPEGYVVLVEGSPGTGKTIFCTQFLAHGAKKGEKGLLITTSAPTFKNVDYFSGFDFYEKSIIKKKLIEFFDFNELAKEARSTGVKNADWKLIDNITTLVRDNNVQRLVIDSIRGVSKVLEMDTYSFLFELSTQLAIVGCTTLVTDESSPGEGTYMPFSDQKFIADAVITLEQVQENGRKNRFLQLKKMRGRAIPREPIYFRINAKGIDIIPPITPHLDYKSFDKRISTGVAGLDAVVGGGLFKASCVFVSGSSGTGKTVFSLHFARGGLDKNEPVVFVSFEEPVDEIYRQASAFGWDLKKYGKENKLKIRSKTPEEADVQEHIEAIVQLIDETKAERLVIDSLSAIANVFGDKETRRMLRALNNECKRRGTTLFVTFTAADLLKTDSISEGHLSTLSDAIILLKYVEMASEIKRSLVVLKIRGSKQDTKIREFEITDKGMVLKDKFMGLEGIMSGRTTKTAEEKFVEAFKL